LPKFANLLEKMLDYGSGAADNVDQRRAPARMPQNIEVRAPAEVIRPRAIDCEVEKILHRRDKREFRQPFDYS
jgi:hypothetical protein